MKFAEVCLGKTVVKLISTAFCPTIALSLVAYIDIDTLNWISENDSQACKI